MEPSRLHELNKIAWEFCELEILELINEGNVWLQVTTLGGVPHYRKWDPADDHNDAAEVKAKLREKGYDMIISIKKNHVVVMIFAPSEGMWEGQHESELIALLLAVEAVMKKEKHA